MTSRQNLCAALDGKTPEAIPLTINHEFVTDDPAWDVLFASGLCVIPYTSTSSAVTPNVERLASATTWRGQNARQITLRTPLGDISQITVNGWIQEYFLKTPADYRVMHFVVRDTRLTPDPTSFLQSEQKLGNRGITLIGIGRSPMQRILVDYAGLENFSFHLASEFPELFALAEALEEQLIETCRTVAAGPGQYVSLLENFTAEAWGPDRFSTYHRPVYRKILPILHAGGKRIFPHLDGRLACVAPLLSDIAFDGIESLTEPPEGDLTYTQARTVWPDKIFWANLNLSLYELPVKDLQRTVRARRQAAAVNGRLLAFEISEDLPANWRVSLPVVLSELREAIPVS